MWGTFEAKEQAVEANVSVGDEAVAHGGEVDGAVMLVDLDGVASAEGDVGSVLAGEMGEDALAADLRQSMVSGEKASPG